MTDQLTKIQVSIARVEEGIGHLVELHETTAKRLDAHGEGIKSLDLTRSRQRGAAKALTAVGILIMGVITWVVDW